MSLTVNLNFCKSFFYTFYFFFFLKKETLTHLDWVAADSPSVLISKLSHLIPLWVYYIQLHRTTEKIMTFIPTLSMLGLVRKETPAGARESSGSVSFSDITVGCRQIPSASPLPSN